MSKAVKYDGAAYISPISNVSEYISLEELSSIISTNRREFIRKYDGHIFCPLCKIPQLTLVSGSKFGNYFLRGYRGQKHSEDCEFGFEDVSTKAFETFIADKNSQEHVNNKLRKLIDKMLKQKNVEEKVHLVKVHNNVITTQKILSIDKERTDIRLLPTKSITAPFQEDDYDCYKLFYGRCNIIVYKNIKDGKPYYILTAHRPKDRQVVCKLSMSEDVGGYFIRNNSLKIGTFYNNACIAFASRFKKDEGNVNKGSIRHSRLCIIDRE